MEEGGMIGLRVGERVAMHQLHPILRNLTIILCIITIFTFHFRYRLYVRKAMREGGTGFGQNVGVTACVLMGSWCFQALIWSLLIISIENNFKRL